MQKSDFEYLLPADRIATHPLQHRDASKLLVYRGGSIEDCLFSDLSAIGDMVVVLTNLSHLQGFEIEDCIDSAYNVIAARTGKMINGTFVKDEN